MKKVVSIVVAICMVLLVFTACSSTPEPAASTGEATAETAEAAPQEDTVETGAVEAPAEAGETFEVNEEDKYADVDAPKYKIGVSYYTFADQLGGQFKKVLEYTAAEYGCEVVFMEWAAVDVESAVEANENLIEAGCDGIIATMLTPSIVEACEQAGVTLVQSCNIVSDPEMLKLVEASAQYIGAVSNDELQAGYDMAQGIYDGGARNIVYVAPTAGTASSHDDRVRGVEKFAEEHEDFVIVSNYRGNEQVDGFRQLMAAYPEVDGVIQTGNNGAVIAAIYSDGLQDQLKFAAIDIQEGTDQYLEDGVCVWIAGGQAPNMQMAFVMLYNALNGNNLIENNTDFLLRPYMYVTNTDEYNAYMTYMEGDIPAYTGNELKDLTVAYNPEATLDMMTALNDSYSLQDVVDRHQHLGME